MTYLIIFEDGTIVQTHTEPTAAELKAIKNGFLDIIRYDPQSETFQSLTQDAEWAPVQSNAPQV